MIFLYVLASAMTPINNEHRNFKEDWTERFPFIERSGKLLFLICNKTIAFMKEYNVRRHYKRIFLNKCYPYLESRTSVNKFCIKTISKNEIRFAINR